MFFRRANKSVAKRNEKKFPRGCRVRPNSALGRLERLEDRRLLASIYVDDSLVITVDQGVGGLDAGDTVTWASGEAGETAGLTFGTDAFSTIQTGIDGASSGDTINVAAGTYNPSATINVTKSLTIEGPQTGNDARPSTGSTRDETDPSTEAIVDAGGSLSRIFLVAADDVTLDGLVITNGTGDLVRSSSPVDNVAIQNNIIHKSSGDEGVQLKQATNSAIQFNYFFDTEGDGANYDGSSSSTIRFNELENIRSTNGAIFVDDSESITIEGNLLNLDHLNQNDGIQVKDFFGDSHSTTIFVIDNVINDSLEDGISIGRSNVVVSGNDISGSSSRNGVIFVNETADNIRIANNSIHDNLASNIPGQTNFAIRIGGKLSTNPRVPTNVVIRDNSIENNEGLIFFQQDTQANLDAARNWWGTTDPAVLAAGMVGLVDVHGQTNGQIDFSSMLTSGTDTDAGTAGFQADTSSLLVHTLGGDPATGSRMQNAVNLVDASGTVEVLTGIYNENVTVDRGVTLMGTPDLQGTLAVSDNATVAPGFSPGIFQTNGLTISGPTLELNSATLGSWTQLDVGPGEDLRYLETVQGENVLFWRGAGGALRRAPFAWDGTTLSLGAITSPSGVTVGDHPSILNLGGGVFEGYFHPGTGPSISFQRHAISTDFGQTWTGESDITYPFPSPGLTPSDDSGTTGGGGVVEIGGQRRIYAQNNFGDIVLWTTAAGSSGPLTNAGALIDGKTGNFQNQSPSGDAIVLPSGQTLYLYTDGEGSEDTLGAVGALLVDSTGLAFTSQLDNFVDVNDPGLSGAGLTKLDEMTLGAVQIVGNTVSGVLMINGDSQSNGSNEDLFYAPFSINLNSVAAGTLSIELNGTTAGAEHDQMDVTGTVDVTGATLNLSLNFAPAVGDSFIIVNNDGADSVTGEFNGFADGSQFTLADSTTGDLFSFVIDYQGGDGNDIEIVNVGSPPTADANGPYFVAEGDTVQLDGSASSDPNQSTNTLTFEWDLDGDNVFGEIGAAAAQGDEVGIAPTFSAANLDGFAGSTFIVALRVTDVGGATNEAMAVVNIANVAPTITELNSANADLEHKAENRVVTIDGDFTDPAGSLDTHTVEVDWGDGGGVETLAAAAVDQVNDEFAASHTYADGGIYTIIVTVRDDDGGVSAESTTSAVASGVGLVDGTLYLIGTDAEDVFYVYRDYYRDKVIVSARLDVGHGYYWHGGERIREMFESSEIDKIVVHACDGADSIHFWGIHSVPTMIFGGGGNDWISGTHGDDFIDGGEGRDYISSRGGDDTIVDTEGDNRIFSGSGNDTITTGDGNDYIVASWGDDTIHAGDGRNKVWAGEGDDLIVSGSGNDWLGGGGGNDVILAGAGKDDVSAGSGNDIVVGGDGNDWIDGGHGRDLLIGGRGRDYIRGSHGDDILIAGFTDYDANEAALEALLAEWSSASDYATRVANITGGGGSLAGLDILLDDTTVHDDNEYDLLIGSRGRDLFFYNFSGAGKKDRAWDFRHGCWWWWSGKEERVDID